MAYVKQVWQPRTGSGLNRFLDQDGNILVLTAAPTEIINPGTPFTADRMNHIEDGIEAAAGILATGLSLPTSGYTSNQIDIEAEGASTDAEKRYLLIPEFSSNAETRAAEKAAWNLIEFYEITDADTLTLTVMSVPTTAVSFSLKEV